MAPKSGINVSRESIGASFAATKNEADTRGKSVLKGPKGRQANDPTGISPTSYGSARRSDHPLELLHDLHRHLFGNRQKCSWQSKVCGRLFICRDRQNCFMGSRARGPRLLCLVEKA